jgi:hypothetical protein
MPFLKLFLRRKCSCASLQDLRTRSIPVICVILRKLSMISNRRLVPSTIGLVILFLHMASLHRQPTHHYFFFREQTSLCTSWCMFDDIIEINSSPVAVKRLVSSLCQQFVVKDLSDLHYFLGTEVCCL